MRFLFTSIRASGHFNPLVPIARGLADRGHAVRFAGIPELGERVAAAGFEFSEFDGPTDAERAEIDRKAAELPPEDAGKWWVPNVFIGTLPRRALPRLLAGFDAWRPDLIVHESCEFAGLIAAELAGIPTARIEVVNGESEEAIATKYTDALDALRRHAGLDPDGGRRHRAEPTYSAHPAVLDDTPRVNAQAPTRYRVPAASSGTTLADGWRAADLGPFVYATFGTVLGAHERMRPLYRAAVEALGRLEVQALLTVGNEAPGDLFAALPGNVTVRAFVPQAEILPLADLMLCHGGSGTVIGALEAAVPMVVAPVAADQPDNARCLAAAGLARVVSGATEPDFAGRLHSALREALADEGARARASAAAGVIAEMARLDDVLDDLERLPG